MNALLSYYIYEQVLKGTANGQSFYMTAYSGGGGGSTATRPTEALNNPYMEAVAERGDADSPDHIHGGPIPPGRYIIRKPGQHPILKLSARLDHRARLPNVRDGFYIHGRGPHGSDGCIVPRDKRQFEQLMTALTVAGGGTLLVEETVEGYRFA